MTSVEPVSKPRRGFKRLVRGWLIALAVVYVIWSAVVYSIQTRLLFPINMIGARPPLVLPEGGGVRQVSIDGPDGPVPTLVMDPTAVTSTGKPAPVIVIFHGNAELAQDYVHERLIEHLRARGNRVVIPEYRGYGSAAGEPSQKGIGADMVAVADWINKQPWCERSKVVYFGWSLGAGVACQLAGQRTPAGLVLQSPFKSVTSFAWGFGVPPFLVKHPFRNDLVLEKLDVPALIIHGTQDSVVPVEHGRALSKIARRGTYVELQGDHFHDWADWGAYLGAIDRWLGERGM